MNMWTDAVGFLAVTALWSGVGVALAIGYHWLVM